MTLGGVDIDCYCGWWFNATRCTIPAPVCDRLSLLIGSPEVLAVCDAPDRIAPNGLIATVMPNLIRLEGGWQNWTCPAMQVSDHWGLATDHTAWIKATSAWTDSAIGTNILRNGVSGLRVGSLQWFMGVQLAHINPGVRVEQPLAETCDLAPPASLVDHFIDELFPAAMGVRQSAAVSSCVRFSVEVARLSAYQEAGLMAAVADQTTIVALWRRRCDMKVAQVTLCEVFGVFDLKNQSQSCPFTIPTYFDGVYSLTPSCLIVYDKYVFDPCLCDPKWCARALNMDTDLNLMYDLDPSVCAVGHVRDMVIDTASGLPPWPAASNTTIPRALARSNFMSTILKGGRNIADNRGAWPSAEGADVGNYCDLVVDWWPDAWTHPVGYHVTLPCTGAAPRTFDASWTALRVGA